MEPTDLSTYMDLRAKRAWLSQQLRAVVDSEDEVELSLVARRGNILEGLCAQLGVDETTGQLMQGTSARPLAVPRPPPLTPAHTLCHAQFFLASLRTYPISAYKVPKKPRRGSPYLRKKGTHVDVDITQGMPPQQQQQQQPVPPPPSAGGSAEA